MARPGVRLPVPNILVSGGPGHLPHSLHPPPGHGPSVHSAPRPPDHPLPVPLVLLPLASIGVTIGEDVDPPAVSLAPVPVPGVVVRPAAECAETLGPPGRTELPRVDPGTG